MEPLLSTRSLRHMELARIHDLVTHSTAFFRDSQAAACRAQA